MHNNPNIHNNPFIYEVNTRVWINNFSENGKLNLDQIPDEYWKSLRKKGFDFIWLMGVWETSESSIEKYCFTPPLVEEYKKALPDFEKSDVIGSPYSIEDYKVREEFGGEDSLKKLKEKLNSFGLRLILDFIPNHFNAESELVKSNPDIFLQGSEEDLEANPVTFYKSGGKVFAHGKDPFYDAWQDTVQLDYSKEETRKFMIDRLNKVAELCDGVRCDMAMLVNNSVFQQTWNEVLTNKKVSLPQKQFWPEAIDSVKQENGEFIFIAEVYWDKEYQMQLFGFDFTYDKTLLDRLIHDDVSEVKSHLWADDTFQQRSVRFIENHDETRSIESIGEHKIRAAAIAQSTLQGMKLIFEGQCEGKKIKLPVQLKRAPKEAPNRELRLFYEKLFSITSSEVFRYGKWEPIEPDQAWDGNFTNENFLVWLWSHIDKRVLVVINYSEESSQCSLKIDTKHFEDEFPLKDLMNDVEYMRSANEINNIGLYVDLQPYQSHIFSY